MANGSDEVIQSSCNGFHRKMLVVPLVLVMSDGLRRDNCRMMGSDGWPCD